MTVQVQDGRLAYAGVAALDGVTLTVADGVLTTLVGPSGCGKSTLLRVIAGVLAADAGRVMIGGVDMAGILPEARGAVMVAQGGLLFPHMNVAQNVGFGLRMRGISDPARVDAALAQVQLAGFGARRPAELSGGQAQRVALARALVVRPRVLLLDEPLSSLDAHLRGEMQVLIRDLQRETGITTLLVTHDRAEAVAMGDAMAVMLAGAVRQVGVPETVYQQPVDVAVARFLGAENFVAGQVGAGLFECALGALVLPAAIPAGKHTVTFRPEAVQVGAGENTFIARVVARSFLGAQVRLALDVAGQAVVALLAPLQAEGVMPGMKVTLHIPARALWVLPAQQASGSAGSPD
jgi:ABC-type Fe3+/spermidine/putrescine transport system ATPase subunit